MTVEHAPRRNGLWRLRESVRSLPGGALAWRIMITVLGGAIIIVGIILLPLPGPGWLIIFTGMGLWATEYAWAARVLKWARARVLAWTHWVQARPKWVQAVVVLLGLAFTGAVSFGCWYLLR